MFEKILLPLDGSELAEAALPYGEELAGTLGADVVLLHVHGPDRSVGYEHVHQIYLDRLVDGLRQRIAQYGPLGTKVKVEARVEGGEPGETVCRLVEASSIDLVVMTAVSAGGLKVGKTLGSVADYICRTVAVPVLLVRPQYARQAAAGIRLIRHLLAPTDGSKLSKLALPVAEGLARDLHAGITVFQMAEMLRPIDDGYGGAVAINYVELDEQTRTLVDREMAALEGELRGKGLDVTRVVTSGYDAAGEIIEVAKKVGADMIVMATHGRSGPGRWIFGNVAEKVVRHGETPVMIVHASAV